MGKRKRDWKFNVAPWEIEAAYYRHLGMPDDIAADWTMLRWLYHGDLRPIAAAIDAGEPIPPRVLELFAEMISEDRVCVRPRGRHRPKEVDKTARDIAAALTYEDRAATSKSKEAFASVAADFGISEEVVAQAVTRWRKSPSHKIPSRSRRAK